MGDALHKFADKMRAKDLEALAISPKRLDQFWARINKTETCWLHERPGFQGYAIFTIRYNCHVGAHRLSLLLEKKKLPKDGVYACHRCRNRHCVRPSHLYWGTPKQNSADTTSDGTRNSAKGTAHFRAKINESIAKQMVQLYAAGTLSVESIAGRFNVSNSCVCYVLTGRTWRDATEGMRVPLRAIGARATKKGDAHYLAKVTTKDVATIRERWDAGESSAKIAKDFGVAPRTVRDVGNRITWKHIP